MNLQKHSSVLTIDGKQIGCYAGFYSLNDLSSVIGGFPIHQIVRNERFLYLLNSLLGTKFSKTDRIVAKLKEFGFYIRHKGVSYCDFRVFVLFYVFSCDEAMLDCITKGFDI